MIFLCFPYVSSYSTLRLFHLLFINLQTRFTRFSGKQWCSWNYYILFFEKNSIVYWQKWIDKKATWFLSWDYLFRDPWFDTSFGERDEMWYSIRETWYTIYIREMQELDLAANKFWLAAWKASLQFGSEHFRDLQCDTTVAVRGEKLPWLSGKLCCIVF